MKLLLKIMYDGRNFSGFQFQPSLRTVQGVLTEALGRFLKFSCSVTGCSRTDSGVHALGFVASVEPSDPGIKKSEWLTVPEGRFHRAVSSFLPHDISVISAAVVDDNLHPRYNVIKKTYIYRIYDRPYRSPFHHKRAYEYKHMLSDSDINLMNKAAGLFVGEKDFRAFMASGSSVSDTVRIIYDAHVERDTDGTVVFSVTGNGFLYNMVRIMTGTLMEVAEGKLCGDEITEAIRTGRRSMLGRTVPPDGLYLAEVMYDREIVWKCE